MDVPLCHGGFADVWKGQHDGRDVVAKVLKIYQTSDLEEIRKVGCSRLVTRIGEFTVSHTEVLQGGRYVEGPLPSERATIVRRDDDRDTVRHGLGVDDKRKHQ